MPLTRGLAASPLGSPSGEHRRSVAGGLEGMWDSAAGIEAAGGGGGGVSCPPELYRRQLEFVRRLVRLSLALRSVPEERRPEELAAGLRRINEQELDGPAGQLAGWLREWGGCSPGRVCH